MREIDLEAAFKHAVEGQSVLVICGTSKKRERLFRELMRKYHKYSTRNSHSMAIAEFGQGKIVFRTLDFNLNGMLFHQLMIETAFYNEKQRELIKLLKARRHVFQS